MNLFNWLEQITVKKQPTSSFTEEDWVSFNSYIIHRYLSMQPEYIELVNYIQRIPNDKKKEIYSVYREMIPKKKVFLKFIAKTKRKSNIEVEQYIAKYFECSLGEAEEYIDILRANGVRGILSEMGMNENEVTKLLKK